jgi:hypothetical protein
VIIALVSVLFVFLGPPATRLKSDTASAEAAMKQDANIPTQYRAELLSLGFPERLSPRGLAHDDLGDTEARLNTIGLAIPRYRDLADGKAAALRQQIASSSMSAALKTNLLAQVDRNAPADHALRQRYWNDEDTRAREWLQVVRLLRANPGRWGLEGGRLAFGSDLFVEVRPHNDVIAGIDADERELCQKPGACPFQ